MQCQYKKIHVLSNECKDVIVTSHSIRSPPRVRLITGTMVRTHHTPFIPTMEHPFDHYLVEVTLGK